jgi:hypothetical protein
VYEEVATKLKGVVKVAKIDVAEYRSIGTQAQITELPTLKFYSNGMAYTHKGRRTADDLFFFAVSFVCTLY